MLLPRTRQRRGIPHQGRLWDFQRLSFFLFLTDAGSSSHMKREVAGIYQNTLFWQKSLSELQNFSIIIYHIKKLKRFWKGEKWCYLVWKCTCPSSNSLSFEPGHFHLVSLVPVLWSTEIVTQVFSLPHVAFQREIYLEFQLTYSMKTTGCKWTLN